MKTIVKVGSFLLMTLSPNVQAQQSFDPSQVNDILKPVHEALEPYKTAQFQHQRGVPVLHPELSKFYI